MIKVVVLFLLIEHDHARISLTFYLCWSIPPPTAKAPSWSHQRWLLYLHRHHPIQAHTSPLQQPMKASVMGHHTACSLESRKMAFVPLSAPNPDTYMPILTTNAKEPRNKGHDLLRHPIQAPTFPLPHLVKVPDIKSLSNYFTNFVG